MLYSDNAKIINTLLAISITDMKPAVRQDQLNTSLKNMSRFIPHIKYLKAKCLKALNLLKVLSQTSWGADRTTLLKLYRSLVQSKLDYGCIIYGSPRK